MAYTTDPGLAKEVRWDTNGREVEFPTLAEMVEAAKKEFPEVPFEQLIITASGYDAEIIELKRKSS
ncbi:MAG: hypothetical protein HYW89_03660 [Candidatus Sungiibacteriota bacterium]|uniref:Uncharacterized protein n=1 Tax=Candidatus Sungiibacteriota bacterium TaxID=2750080 RepID=A0A7T5UQG3_9BACT|nr:MAG: hypothetical protein HYW89_03660 [Candidatus Sungbacteria bacterium]